MSREEEIPFVEEINRTDFPAMLSLDKWLAGEQMAIGRRKKQIKNIIGAFLLSRNTSSHGTQTQIDGVQG